jgi:capsular exopolysaccharide synthesis family protein
MGGRQLQDKEARAEETMPKGSLRDLYYVLFRHKWRIVLFFAIVMVATLVGVIFATDIYSSQARLLVRLGRENVTLDPTATTGKIIPVRPSRESEMNTELEILTSQQIAEMVVDSIGAEALLYKEHPVAGSSGATMAKIKRPLDILAKRIRQLKARSGKTGSSDKRDDAIRMVMNNLQVGTQKTGNTIGLAYASQNPQLAQEVLNKLIDSYLERHIAIHQTPGSHQFFTQQSNHLRDKVTQLEDELRKLRNETGITSLDEQQRVILDRISVLEKDKNDAEIALAASTATVGALQKTLADMPDTVVTEVTEGFPNVAADGMRQRLYELQLQEQDLASKFEPESRQVRDIRLQVAAAEALLSKEKPERTQISKGLNTTYVSLQAALLGEQASMSSLQAQAETLKTMLASARAELSTLNDVEVKVKALAREIEIQDANYRKYSENLEQARIDDALETGKISNISILQAATLPVRPASSRRMLTLLLGLAVGIFGGIGLAFISEYADHSIKTPKQAEDTLGLSTLTCIPYVPTFSMSRQAKVKGYHEALDVLEEQLLLGVRGTRKLRVLAITGSHRHEGVSAVAANLATTLARLGQGDVLLVDANLGHPSVHETFKTKLSPGLADTLTNGSNNGDAVTPSQVHNLHILSAGTTKRSFSEIFGSDDLRKLLNSMKKNYRFVVLDLPAVNEASWAIRLACLCDGVCLVVEAERSRWEVVDRVREQLVRSNANLLGVVLNKRKLHIPQWLYRTL